MSSLSSGSRQLLEIADKELQRLSHITARSLKFYRQRTAPASVALDEVIDSVIYFHDPSIRLRNIAIERRYLLRPQFCASRERFSRYSPTSFRMPSMPCRKKGASLLPYDPRRITPDGKVSWSP